MKLVATKVASVFPEIDKFLAEGYALITVDDSVMLCEICHTSKTIKISKVLLQ